MNKDAGGSRNREWSTECRLQSSSIQQALEDTQEAACSEHLSTALSTLASGENHLVCLKNIPPPGLTLVQLKLGPGGYLGNGLRMTDLGLTGKLYRMW